MMIEHDVIIREAEKEDAERIYRILDEAFASYQKDYTKDAYRKTVISTGKIEGRLDDPYKVVLVAEIAGVAVGTATIDISGDGYYLQSMAVQPDIQRKGLALLMLDDIKRRARQHNVTELTLECYEPLTNAIRLYEKCGFQRTGKRRSYHGITIFEMKKELLPLIDNQYINVLRKIFTKLKKQSVSWALTGRLNFALHGLAVTIHDIDIQTDKEGAYKIEKLFAEHMTRRVTYRSSTYIRSYFGTFALDGITVEIMGDIRKKLKNGTWEEPVNVNDHKELIVFEGMDMPTLSLEYERKAYRQLGRIEKTVLLREHLMKQKKKIQS